MKRFILAAALVALSGSAFAQNSTNAATGQTPGGIQSNVFQQNSETTGFAENAIATVAGVGTSQATATTIPARTVIVTSCVSTGSGGGLVLPSIVRYTAIAILNRSGGSCLVYPSPSATLETAAGTMGAANAPATLLTNTDTVFRPNPAGTAWYQ